MASAHRQSQIIYLVYVFGRRRWFDAATTNPSFCEKNLISSSRSSDSPVEHQSSQWDPCISSHPRRWQKGKRKKEKATSNLLHRSLVRSSDQTVRSTTPMYIWAVSTFSHSVSTCCTLQIKGDNTCSPSHRLQISKLLGGLLVGERAHGWVLLPFHFALVPPSCL